MSNECNHKDSKPNPFHDPNHPIWALIRQALLTLGLTAALYLTANHFDSTELKTIITMVLIGGSVEGVSTFVSKYTKKGGD